MSARDRILGRIRAGAAGRRDPDRAEQAARRIVEPPAPLIPHQAASQGRRRAIQFMAKAEAAAATIGRVSSLAELPRAVAHELRKRDLPPAIRAGADPAFRGLDWGQVAVSRGPGRLEEPATLGRAEFGLAETGSLAMASGPDNPVTLTFLGETHFVVLRTADLCAGFEDFWAAWRARGLDPRTLTLVTGPSRSADIGQVLQLGAHGPIALHVFLLE